MDHIGNYEYNSSMNMFNCYSSTLYVDKDDKRKVLIHTTKNIPGISGIPTCSCINEYETYIVPELKEIGSYDELIQKISAHCLFETWASLDELNKKYQRKTIKI